MNEIEKEIEEMARDIYEQKSCDTSFEGNCKLLAYDLVTLGYQNCQDKVVLTKEEWKQIKNSLYYSREALERKLEKARKETAKEIIDKIDDMIGGKLIAQALREIYLEKE